MTEGEGDKQPQPLAPDDDDAPRDVLPPHLLAAAQGHGTGTPDGGPPRVRPHRPKAPDTRWGPPAGAKGGQGLSYHTSGHQSNNRRIEGPDNRLYAFGDSFIGPLSLLTSVYFSRFSGASAKGLSRVDTTKQARIKIFDILAKRKPASIFFGFGNVDLQINYYYKLSTLPDPGAWLDPFVFAEGIATGYLAYLREVLAAWSATTPGKYVPPSRRKRLYLSSVIFPVIETEYFPKAFGKYTKDFPFRLPDPAVCGEMVEFLGTTLPVQHPECAGATRLDDIRIRRRMVQLFNERLRTFCRETGCIYVDVNPYIADAQGNVLPAYRDPADPTNIHILWEPVLPFWVKELASAGINMEHVGDDIACTLEEYVLDKTYRVQRREERWKQQREEAEAQMREGMGDAASDGGEGEREGQGQGVRPLGDKDKDAADSSLPSLEKSISDLSL